MQGRTDFSRAMIGSVVLHAGVIVLLLVSRMWEKTLPIGSVVPVTIVSNASVTDLRAAEKADQVQTAQTEAPVPEAAPEPAATAAEPLQRLAPPAPAKAAPAPTPPPPAAAAPAKPAKPAKPLDLDALAASIAKTAGAKSSSAARGQPRPETALEARDAAGAGKGVSAAAMAGLANELQRRWNPNCEVEGGKDVKIRVTFMVGAGGQLIGMVEAGGLENSANPVVKAAAERAIRAVHQAAPFSTLPRDFLGQRVAVNFNAREACA
jgi:periplasmic protein TonB